MSLEWEVGKGDNLVMDLENSTKVNQVILETICGPNSMTITHAVLETFCSQSSIGLQCEHFKNVEKGR